MPVHSDEALISASVILFEALESCVAALGGRHETRVVDPRDQLALLALVEAAARRARRAAGAQSLQAGLRVSHQGTGEELVWVSLLVWASAEHHVSQIEAAEVCSACPACAAPLLTGTGGVVHAQEHQRPAAQQVSEQRGRARQSWDACEAIARS